jgi:hypothetical protein
MRVPKMVKNGLNSSFGIWGQFQAAYSFCTCDLAEVPSFSPSFTTAKISPSNKPTFDPNGQKKNKNHFTPISEQACAR